MRLIWGVEHDGYDDYDDYEYADHVIGIREGLKNWWREKIRGARVVVDDSFVGNYTQILSGKTIVDMSQVIQELDVDTSAFNTLLMGLDAARADNPDRILWWEDEMFPRLSAEFRYEDLWADWSWVKPKPYKIVTLMMGPGLKGQDQYGTVLRVTTTGKSMRILAHRADGHYVMESPV